MTVPFRIYASLKAVLAISSLLINALAILSNCGLVVATVFESYRPTCRVSNYVMMVALQVHGYTKWYPLGCNFGRHDGCSWLYLVSFSRGPNERYLAFLPMCHLCVCKAVLCRMNL